MNHKTIICINFILFSLVACGGDVKSTLGMRKQAPNEFMVISNPPLKEPPEFRLTPPEGAHSALPASDIIERGIIQPSDLKSLTPGERNFLHQLDVMNTSDVKNLIDRENAHKQNENESKGGIRKLLSKVQGAHEEPVIDPIAERTRLKDNSLNNKPINEGDIVNKSTKSTIDRLLN